MQLAQAEWILADSTCKHPRGPKKPKPKPHARHALASSHVSTAKRLGAGRDDVAKLARSEPWATTT